MDYLDLVLAGIARYHRIPVFANRVFLSFLLVDFFTVVAVRTLYRPVAGLGAGMRLKRSGKITGLGITKR
jgi:hypothetical protein